MRITIDGTINVPWEDYDQMDILPWVYIKSNKDVAMSFSMVKGEKVRLPRNFQKFIRSTGWLKKDMEIIDERLEVPLSAPLPIKDNFKLRDYQEGPVRDVLKFLKDTRLLNSGVLQAEPGFGKTYILPKIVAEVGQKTMILVDRNLLAKQMFDEFTHNTNADVRIIRSDSPELGDINISTFQMFFKNKKLLQEAGSSVGFLIVDECHVAPAETFSEIIATFSAKYRLGLSATPTRSDGLTEVITDTFGFKKVIGVNPDSLKVNLVAVRTGLSAHYTAKSGFAEAFTETATSAEVLGVIEESVKVFHKQKRAIVLYTTYKNIQNTYKTLVESMGLSAGVVSSKTSHKERDLIITRFNEGELDILISGVIISKGVSIHRMDTIINVSTHNKESLEQTIGRLRREHDSKQTPLFVDLGFTGSIRRNTEDRFERLYGMKGNGDKFFLYNIYEYENMLRKK